MVVGYCQPCLSNFPMDKAEGGCTTKFTGRCPLCKKIYEKTYTALELNQIGNLRLITFWQEARRAGLGVPSHYGKIP